VTSPRMTLWVAILTLTSLSCAGWAKAQGDSANYMFLVASGSLCDPGDSAACRAEVKSANGDAYEMTGAGTFDVENKSVKAAGTFIHKSTSGKVLQTGVWIASTLVSFVSYGRAPAALPRESRRLDPQESSLGGLKKYSGSMPTGGLAVFRILLYPVSGAAKTAVLEANCALGEVPRERAVEGVRLAFAGNGGEFSEEVSGRVMFLSMAPEVKAHAQSLAPELTPNSAEPSSR